MTRPHHIIFVPTDPALLIGGFGFRMAPTVGRACIAVAAALGEWPGGAA